MYKDAKIYVAGHTGLLGSALVKKLRAEGFTSIVTRTHQELDLTRQEPVEVFFAQERPEYVFLCAGLTGGIQANKTCPARFLHINMMIQSNVFEAAHYYEVKHLIFYGSSCIYPKNSPQPMKEECLLTGEIEVTSEAYAAAKIAGIIACRSYNEQFGTNRFIALVPNSMYGPNDNFDLENSHVLSALMRKLNDAKEQRMKNIVLWGSGNPRREFVFSEEIADASIFAVKNADKFINSHYNIGNGVDYSIKELAYMIAEIVGYKGEMQWDPSKPDGVHRKLLNSEKFISLGWKPAMSFDEGLKKTYKWFIKNWNSVRVK